MHSNKLASIFIFHFLKALKVLMVRFEGYHLWEKDGPAIPRLFVSEMHRGEIFELSGSASV